MPFRQHADIRPLELDISCERDWDSAGCGEVALETGEYPIERAQAAGEQAMGVPILRRARPRSSRCGQVVALQYVNLVKGFGQSASSRKPANSGANDNRPAAQLVRSAALLAV
jgi:hypothetical protein